MISVENVRLVRDHVDKLRLDVEQSLSTIIPESEPRSLYEPAQYVLSGGGKRLRPVLLLLTAEAFGASVKEAMPAALAVEVFHNFTLVHDDIMDNADTRRGKPTVHTKWDASTAILSGDYMMGLSYALLSQTGAGDLSKMMSVYHRMVQLLCEGQAFDTDFETRTDVTVDEYIRMIDGKTAALLEAVFELGGLIGGVNEYTQNQLRLLGQSVGRAFQIQDDLLDITAENAKWGKKVGGDLIEGKKTYLLLRAIESTTGSAQKYFNDIVVNGGLPEEKIAEARAMLEEHGILEYARQAVLEHTAIATSCLDVLGESDAARAVKWLVAEMQNRLH